MAVSFFTQPRAICTRQSFSIFPTQPNLWINSRYFCVTKPRVYSYKELLSYIVGAVNI